MVSLTFLSEIRGSHLAVLDRLTTVTICGGGVVEDINQSRERSR